jgi:muramoyltetrapeptide carboxypeptidase
LRQMPTPLKPPALRHGDGIRILSLASPVKIEHLDKGCEELVRLGYAPESDQSRVLVSDGYFAGSSTDRLFALRQALAETSTRAIFCSRGGYGSTYLLEGLTAVQAAPKILLGSSDITALQIFLWQKFCWVSFYGPMVASNFDRGQGAPHGYDFASFARALTETKQGWELDLAGEPLAPGTGSGVLLGGCLTLVESTLGTPWEIDTRGAILILEDRGMKPYQVDRALTHLRQAGKFEGITGIILGDFPECESQVSSDTVVGVALRILGSRNVPLVWGAPIGHTSRAALTIPLGIRAELRATGAGMLRILEPACSS